MPWISALLPEVSETLRLLSEGDQHMGVEDLSNQDLVLVLGNTGVGKTTMTKFLAQTHLLEAYDRRDRILIRDRDGKIHGDGSTTLFKTILPDLIVDKETGTAFYNLPGFSDMRNISMELANSYYMHKVSNRARGVKLLFVVNYSSLRMGESRADFKYLLENAVDLMKDPSHFVNSTALLVTKVETPRSSRRIYNGIQFFLQQFRQHLLQIFSDQDRSKRAAEFIDVLLSEDSGGNLNKIAFFRQPDEDLGPLVDMPDMLEQKKLIQNIIANLNYTEMTDNFGINISYNARALCGELANEINVRITRAVNQTALKLEQHFQNAAMTGKLCQVSEHLKDFISSLERIHQTSSHSDFLNALKSDLAPLKIPDLTPELTELTNRDANLRFLEHIRKAPISSAVPKWKSTMMEAALRAKKLQVPDSALAPTTNATEDTCRLGSPSEPSMMAWLQCKARSTTKDKTPIVPITGLKLRCTCSFYV